MEARPAGLAGLDLSSPSGGPGWVPEPVRSGLRRSQGGREDSRGTCVRPLPAPHLCARPTPPFSWRPATVRIPSQAEAEQPSTRASSVPAANPNSSLPFCTPEGGKSRPGLGSGGQAPIRRRGLAPGGRPDGAHLLSGASRHQWGRSCWGQTPPRPPRAEDGPRPGCALLPGPPPEAGPPPPEHTRAGTRP